MTPGIPSSHILGRRSDPGTQKWNPIFERSFLLENFSPSLAIWNDSGVFQNVMLSLTAQASFSGSDFYVKLRRLPGRPLPENKFMAFLSTSTGLQNYKISRTAPHSLEIKLVTSVPLSEGEVLSLSLSLTY